MLPGTPADKSNPQFRIIKHENEKKIGKAKQIKEERVQKIEF